ncbi:tetratricopeptide repeat-containing sulfotransferase family protein [Colwellia sp. TT2012]|uniref:tetratricopeptide repeat-containing sulfotransferase family protein n=1 Tax=Colwellia sp. TT2012 TaxID=1720342 RepID=UPI00070C48D9|nr:sulfotransferase [Colwellia sp. TT2012]
MKRELTVNEALRLLNANRALEGCGVLDKLLLKSPNDIQAHQVMVKLAFKTKNLTLAEKHLKILLTIQPGSDHYANSLIELYCQQNRWFDVASIYLDLAQSQTENPMLLFNCAYYMKLAGKFDEALVYYNKVLNLGINDQYEVYLNIAIIYSEHLSDPDKAINILTHAISIYPDQDSLLYNLANVYEQLGNKEKAISSFKAAFNKNPQNYDALARQADIYKISQKTDDLISKMANVYHSDNISLSNKINIAYALGKSHDDCGEYFLAFDFYQQANNLDQQILPQYNKKSHEVYVNKVINTFNKSWFETLKQPVNKQGSHADCQAPIFICGMFRSGSTLCEQILAGHSQISIGGEQEFFHRTIVNNCADYPSNVSEYLTINKENMLDEYLKEINQFRKKGNLLTDKRPDNFLYLGVIKTLMPEAKIIWTRRSMLDNCLSVFFLRLGASMAYATKLENTIHFYQQQEKLMNHWQTLFAEDIYEFNYDELVEEPESNIKNLLSFIDLPWENSCLQFHQVENQVKTASVWQVRQPLYKSASGRWKNYQHCLKNLALI